MSLSCFFLLGVVDFSMLDFEHQKCFDYDPSIFTTFSYVSSLILRDTQVRPWVVWMGIPSSPPENGHSFRNVSSWWQTVTCAALSDEAVPSGNRRYGPSRVVWNFKFFLSLPTHPASTTTPLLPLLLLMCTFVSAVMQFFFSIWATFSRDWGKYSLFKILVFNSLLCIFTWIYWIRQWEDLLEGDYSELPL